MSDVCGLLRTFEDFPVMLGNCGLDMSYPWLMACECNFFHVKRSKDVAARAINVKIDGCTITQKHHENFRIHSNGHSGHLIRIWGLGSVNSLSSRGSEN